ncbi:MAG: LuxR C-terminal-related transcriptional regulator [Bryobacteraceae bacterium]
MTHNLISRQRQIVAGIALGKTRAEIALVLGLSIKTVEFHINNTDNPYSIRHKLGFSDTARLTHWAIQHHLVKLGAPL